MTDIAPVYTEKGSRYYECPECATLAHVAPSAPADFIPTHAAGDPCKGKFVKRSRPEWLQAHADALPDPTPEAPDGALVPTEELPPGEDNGARVYPGSSSEGDEDAK